MLRFNFNIPEEKIKHLPLIIMYVVTVRGIIFLIAKTHTIIFKYTSTNDAFKLSIAILTGTIVFFINNYISFYLFEHFLIPTSIVIIDFIASSLGLITIRAIVKLLYMQQFDSDKEKINVIIYGAGEEGIITKKALEHDKFIKYNIIAFVDNNPNLKGKIIDNVKIIDLKSLFDIINNKNDISQLIISNSKISNNVKKQIIDICLNNNINVLTVPPINNWINGELNIKQIRKVRIEDLLERDVISLDTNIISKQLTEKTILVTGAAGSIGSELVRQILKFVPEHIILLDIAETPLFNIDLELQKNGYRNYSIILTNILNKNKIDFIFNKFKPDIVFHAAAYKHVPMMELNAYEAVQNNVLGTKILADTSIKYNVDKFVMISTDKAVNPTNIMGASKRIAEIYTQSLNKLNKTKFVTTRFGNVLGSNGSVVQLFKKQIEEGGPITITDPAVTRYFMTIPEASQLVLQAGAMGNGGEIFIFDMGKPVKIVDLAKKMVKLSGLELGKDINLIYTGLRPGEKLYEELLNNNENTIKTNSKEILIAKVTKYDLEYISTMINELLDVTNYHDDYKIVAIMKKIVPEYISQNSIYAKLDN